MLILFKLTQGLLVMLDLNTFGKTPAAIYLVDRLNFLNDKKLTRKISSKINSTKAIIAEAVNAHEAGLISTHTLSFIAATLRSKVDTSWDNTNWNNTEQIQKQEELPINLMKNLLIGELKNIIRKASKVKHLKKRQQKIVSEINNDVLFPVNLLKQSFKTSDGLELVNTKEVLTVKKIMLKNVTDPITSEVLIEKSRAKLIRKNKINTLYNE